MIIFDEPVVREPIAMSALEFDVLWQHLGLGEMPLAIRVPSPGRTHTERAQLERQAWEGLAQRGLGRQLGVDDELVGLLRLLARPAREVDGRLWLGRRVRVLAAGREEDGVLAVLDSDQLTVRPFTGRGLAREAVSVLPPLGAGPGHSVTLPSADLDAAAAASSGSAEGLEAALQERGIRAQDAHELVVMVTRAGHSGQFGAAARDRLDRRQRTDHVIGFFDTPAGRYLQTRHSVDGGIDWSTIAPADSRRLAQLVDELLNPDE